MSERIRLGPFELQALIGRGGMGEVWRGVHVEQGLEVAIKVITRYRPRRVNMEAFRDEVRAMAGLRHPGIAMVFDEGQIPPLVERASEGRLSAGSPYLVMEHAGMGTLERFEGRALPWGVCRAVAGGLLGALAHAHARGVIHRDIKPANVLLAGPEDVRPGLKLTDFGIAHIMEAEEHSDRAGLTMGTPHFMAPEQFEGRWRDYGPWTDLYALGVMLWLLITGDLPFDGRSALQLARHHLLSPPPELGPSRALPEGLETWLGRLLAKEPARRFQRAADAAEALSRLDPHAVEVPRDPARLLTGLLAGEGGGDTQQMGQMTTDAQTHMETATTATSTTTSVRRSRSAVVARLDRAAPPLPASWRSADARAGGPVQLLGVGMRLFELRRVPQVGRERERDMLWDALKAAHSEQRAQAVVLRGAAGVGKSRLARWLCHRAHELGVATILKARHSPIPGPGTGLSGMLARELRCVGADPDTVIQRAGLSLSALGVDDPHAHQALARLVHPDLQGDFETPASRYAFIRRFVEQMSRTRPVILWLDDLQWGADAIGLAGHILKSRDRSPHPILVLLTARDEALAEAPVARWALREVATLSGVQRIDLGPLEAPETAALIEELLIFDPDLAGRLAQRCGGNPLFAVQLVSDWIHRGALRPGPEGFVLSLDQSAALPDNLHAVWRERVTRTLSGQPESARHALEIAAALGNEVHPREWAEACAWARVTVPEGLLDTLLTKRLAFSDEGSWRFAHGMLRESLERTALEQGRSRPQNRACAAMLGALYPEGTHNLRERRGRHLLASGACEEAASLLFEAVEAHMRRSELRLARGLLDVYEEALQGAGISEIDPRWSEGWVIKARILAYQGRLERAHEVASQALDLSEALGWEKIRPQALRGLADIERLRVDLPRATAHYEEALEAFEAMGDEARMAACLTGMGSAAQQRGDLDSATAYLERAVSLWASLGQTRNLAHGTTQLAHIAQSRGELARWEALVHRAEALYRDCGDPFSLAMVHNELAEIARNRGDLEAAEAGYRKAASLCAAAGVSEDVARINLALVLLGRGRFVEARASIEAIRAGVSRGGQRGVLAYIHAALLACAADTGAVDQWDTHLSELHTLLDETGIVDPDLAWCAQLAAERARANGHAREAAEACALALSQWTSLGETARIEEVEALAADV